MRLFVCIDIPKPLLEEIYNWIPEQKGWNKVSVHQMHLTLAFLGECSKVEMNLVTRKLSKIVFLPFEVTIEGLNAFPNRSSPKIIWAGVQKNEQLLDLKRRITDSIGDHSESKHKSSYIPHITLARKKNRKGINHIVKKNLQRETGKISTNVTSFKLKQSLLKPEGSEHYIVNSYKATKFNNTDFE